jgi:hypothetical protein
MSTGMMIAVEVFLVIICPCSNVVENQASSSASAMARTDFFLDIWQST